MGAEDRDLRSGADSLEHSLPALDGERAPGVGGEERPVVTEIGARAEIAVDLAPDGGVELDHPAPTELRGLGSDRERAGREVEIGDAGLAGFI